MRIMKPVGNEHTEVAPFNFIFEVPEGFFRAIIKECDLLF